MDSLHYYRTLGIAPSASDNEIRWAYRRLAKRLHPDVSVEVDGECRFKAVTEAYRTLKGPATRQAYDRRPVPAGEAVAGAWPTAPEPYWFAMSPWNFWAAFWN